MLPPLVRLFHFVLVRVRLGLGREEWPLCLGLLPCTFWLRGVACNRIYKLVIKGKIRPNLVLSIVLVPLPISFGFWVKFMAFGAVLFAMA